jgi:uncharacterized protein YndB with AHSA1/START domain
MRIVIETMIAAPPAKVFALMADIPRWPENISAIEKLEMLTPGPVAVGTRFRETRTMYGRQATEEMTVAQLEPPTRMVLTAESHGMRYVADHVLQAEAGGTRLTLTFEGEPQTLGARLMRPLGWLMKRTITRQLAADIADLKRAAEAW